MTRSRRRKLQRISAGDRARRLARALPLAPVLFAGIPAAYGQSADSAVLEEVVVTAQKQQENLQAVPMSIQAFGTERLQELRITNFVDYAKFMPSVSFQTLGPGFTRVFMRGVASGDNGNHSGPMPSVGMYLDEQPITTIQGSLDVHLYDIERVEMLAGPQGTLYGASSQAGTIRTITNKPDATKFSASYDLQGTYVEDGDQGYTAEGYVNIPLSDSAAIRLVGWYEHTPGYIDNVAGSMYFPSADITVTNSNRVKDNYNDVDTWGGRAALRIDLNDTWAITPAVMGQVQKANGIFAYDQNVGDLQVAHFFPEWSDDQWVQAALTVEGKIGNFDVVYAGAYLDRTVDSRSEYSDYSYWYDVLYGYGASIYNNDGALINPQQFIVARDGYTMWSNEIRVSSPRDQRFRFVAGLFAQQAEHRITQDYRINDLWDETAVTGNPDTLWLTDQTRTDESYAFFGEMYYDFTDKLTGTLGIRLFQTDNSLKGFFGFSANYSSKTGEAACFNDRDYYKAPCINLNKDTDESGNTPKASLAYRFDEDRMVYLTYSEGFRPGGVNRRGTFPPYKADYLTNYEAGWKTTWAGGSVRFNGAIFLQEWDDFQYSYLGENGLTNVRNAGKAEIDGIEAYVDWAAMPGLLLTAGATWLDPKLAENFCQAIDEDPCSEANFAPDGTQLPVTPTFKGNLIARYSFDLGSYQTTVQGSYVYQNEVEAELLPSNRQFSGTQASFGVADFSGEVRRGPYALTLYVNNAFDERAELYKYQECATQVCGFQVGSPYTTYTGTNQPRTIGLIFRQEF